MLFILAPHTTRRPNLMGVRRKCPNEKTPQPVRALQTLKVSPKPPNRLVSTEPAGRTASTPTPHTTRSECRPLNRIGVTHPTSHLGFKSCARVPSSGDYSQARKGTKPHEAARLFKRASDSTGAFSRRAFRGEGATANFRAILN